MPRLRLDVWSDLACPWCYVGKRRLEAALASFAHREQVEVVWRSFELDPGAPREQPRDVPHVRRLAAKYRMTEAEAQARTDHLVAVAAADGLDLRFDRLRSGNTFDAHRLLHQARAAGRQDAVKERFLRGYFTEGAALGDPAVLRTLAVEAGLDGAAVDALLAGDAHAAAVRDDESLARELGIRGVPFFVLDRRLAVSGAQPAATLRAALVQAWETLVAGPVATSDAAPDGAACGPDGCA